MAASRQLSLCRDGAPAGLAGFAAALAGCVSCRRIRATRPQILNTSRMQLGDSARSYYLASAQPAPKRPALQGAITCDVCVVGGGFAGCSAALHLTERGFRVALLEAEHIGWGASGRSGAQALAGVAAGQAKLERLLGEADARSVWDVSVAGLTLIRELIDRHRIGCDWVSGHMQVAIKQRHETELHEELETLRGKYQYEGIRYVSRAEVQDLIASRRYIGALHDANCGHLHPLNYTLGLAAAAERAGVQIFEHTRALEILGEARPRVRTTAGDVYC